MIINMPYWTRVFKNIFYIVFILLSIYLALKLSLFYMPFLVAFIISLMIEPLIKFIMKKTDFTRRTSSIIIFLIVSVIIIFLLSWLVITITNETSSLLKVLNEYLDKANILIQDIIKYFDLQNIEISKEISDVINNSTNEVLNSIAIWLRNVLTNLIDIVTSLPSIFISIGITVVALYFICVDKIYIVDQLEHHLPKLWIKKIGVHFREITKKLGGYLKAEATLILTSFIISLIGLYILEAIGFSIAYPLLMAIFIGFIDALPILRLWNYYDSLGYSFSN